MKKQDICQMNEAERYIRDVLSHVRSRRAHEDIRRELAGHIEDQARAFREEGMDEEAARGRAVAEMGEAGIVGAQLNAAHRPKTHWTLLISVALLVLAGMLFRGAVWGISDSVSMLPLCAVVFVCACFVDYFRVRKYAYVFYGAALLCAVVYALLRGSGAPTISGRFPYAPYFFLAIPPVYACLVYKMRGRGYAGLLLCGALAALLFAVCVPLAWNSVLFVIALACLGVLTVAICAGHFGARRLYALLIAWVPCVCVCAGLFAAERLAERFAAQLADPTGAGYMLHAVRAALASTVPFGAAPATEHVAWLADGTGISYDFALVDIAVRFGRVPMYAVLLLALAYLLAGLIIALRQRSVFSRLLAVSVVLTIAAQCLLVALSNLGVFYIGALPLPFVSYGRASLICNSALVGILFSALRSAHPDARVRPEDAQWRAWIPRLAAREQ